MAGAAGGFGSSGGKSGTSPGFVDPFSTGLLAQNTGMAEQAMHNRYQQLGLGVPSGGTGGGPGGPAAGAAAGGTSLSYGSPGTAEQMDLGQLPSLVGGIPAMGAATLGQMQNNALGGQTGAGTGKGGFGPAISGIGSLGSLAGGF